MGNITRRLFLRTAATASAAATTVAVAVEPETKAPYLEPLVYAEDRCTIMGRPVPTPIERFDAAVIELKRAVNAIDPSISDWKIDFAATDDLLFRFMAIASRKPTNT